MKFLRSLIAYLRLYRAGLEISNWSDPDVKKRYERFRFFWKGTIIRDFADISRFDNHWNTMNNGHVEDLK